MLVVVRSTAFVLFCVGLGASAGAQIAAQSAPPGWRDAGSSYLMIPPPANGSNNAVVASANRIAPPPKQEPLVMPAAHAEVVEGNILPQRHLAPPGGAPAQSPNARNPLPTIRQLPIHLGIPSNVAYTVGSALAIVVGLFLLFAWMLRRGWKGAANRLPGDVVNILGRVPLTGKQYADLLRVGNKLVLVAQTPSGPTTLTEITDSKEVDRLVGLCQEADPRSTTKAFEKVFRQLAREAAPGGFLGHEPSSTPPAHSMDSLRQYRNEAARG